MTTVDIEEGPAELDVAAVLRENLRAKNALNERLSAENADLKQKYADMRRKYTTLKSALRVVGKALAGES